MYLQTSCSAVCINTTLHDFNPIRSLSYTIQWPLEQLALFYLEHPTSKLHQLLHARLARQKRGPAWLPAMDGHTCQHCCHWAQVVISSAQENLHPLPERVCFQSFDVHTNCERVAWVIHGNIGQSQVVCRITVMSRWRSNFP